MTELADRPTARAELRPMLHASLGMTVSRRPADRRDVHFERDLFAESRDDLLLLPVDTRDVIVDMQFRAQRRMWRLAYPDARHEMLLVRGVRAGHVLVDDGAADLVVVDVAVRVGLRGLGIGTDVLTELTRAADATGRVVRTRVWSSNHGARRLFERSGFVPGGSVAGFHELYRPPVGVAA